MAAPTSTEAEQEPPAVAASEPEADAESKPAAESAPKAPKAKKAKKKDSKESEGAEAAGEGPSVAAHPRAARQIGRMKGWGGLGGFLVGGYLSLPTHTLVEVGARALIAGVLCYVFAWAAGVFVWRRLVVLEIKGREQQLAAVHLDPETRGAIAPQAERARVAS